jgi:hypothetical protein
MKAGPFRIEYGDKTFAIASPDGEATDAVPYCSFASIEFEGRVYAAYLNGEEEEIDPGEDKPNHLDPKQPTALVYDVTDWPAVVPVETESEGVDIEGDEVDDGPLAPGGIR